MTAEIKAEVHRRCLEKRKARGEAGSACTYTLGDWRICKDCPYRSGR